MPTTLLLPPLRIFRPSYGPNGYDVCVRFHVLFLKIELTKYDKGQQFNWKEGREAKYFKRKVYLPNLGF